MKRRREKNVTILFFNASIAMPKVNRRHSNRQNENTDKHNNGDGRSLDVPHYCAALRRPRYSNAHSIRSGGCYRCFVDALESRGLIPAQIHSAVIASRGATADTASPKRQTPRRRA